MDQKIEKAISKLLKIYEKIENDLLIEIASHFSINEEFLNSDYWRIKKLEEMGLFNQDIIDYLKRETGKTGKEVLKALNQIGIDTINLDKLNRLFEDEILKINPNILSSNYAINSIINTAYNELNDTLIQMSNKIEKSAREAYLNVIENAYLKTSMGTHSYQEAIRTSINDLSNKGITILTYKTIDENDNITGIRNYDIEGAVRREVLTASRQLSNNISMEVANELDCEYLYLSEHLQCRPSHFDWQGTIIKREDLVKITHYGEVDGLAGINCRHYFEPYFGDARDDELKIFNKEACTKAYNLSQHQRYLERGIRTWKRKAEMYKASEDIEIYKKCKSKVKEWRQRNIEFTKDNNLRRDFNREYVSERKNKKITYKDVTQEWLNNAKPNSHEVLDRQYFEHDNIKYQVDNKNVVLNYSKHEKEIAEWLENTFGGELYMLPKINKPDGISTADYLFRNEYWDLKDINGNGKNVLFHAIEDHEKQAHNFIFNIVNSNLTNKELEERLNKLYSLKKVKWLDKVIIKRDENVVLITQKSSPSD